MRIFEIQKILLFCFFLHKIEALDGTMKEDAFFN